MSGDSVVQPAEQRMRQASKLTISKSKKAKKKDQKEKDDEQGSIIKVLDKWKDPQPPHGAAEPQNADFVLEVESNTGIVRVKP